MSTAKDMSKDEKYNMHMVVNGCLSFCPGLERAAFYSRQSGTTAGTRSTVQGLWEIDGEGSELGCRDIPGTFREH